MKRTGGGGEPPRPRKEEKEGRWREQGLLYREAVCTAEEAAAAASYAPSVQTGWHRWQPAGKPQTVTLGARPAVNCGREEEALRPVTGRAGAIGGGMQGEMGTAHETGNTVRDN